MYVIIFMNKEGLAIHSTLSLSNFVGIYEGAAVLSDEQDNTCKIRKSNHKFSEL